MPRTDRPAPNLAVSEALQRAARREMVAQIELLNDFDLVAWLRSLADTGAALDRLEALDRAIAAARRAPAHPGLLPPDHASPLELGNRARRNRLAEWLTSHIPGGDAA